MSETQQTDRYLQNLAKFDSLLKKSTSSQQTESADNKCKYDNCRLKSVHNSDFCYQHIAVLIKKTNVKCCQWIDRRTGEHCNQLVYSNLSKLTPEDQNLSNRRYCINHSALLKQKHDANKEKYQLVIDSQFERDAASSNVVRDINLDSVLSRTDKPTPLIVFNEQKFLQDTSMGRERLSEHDKEEREWREQMSATREVVESGQVKKKRSHSMMYTSVLGSTSDKTVQWPNRSSTLNRSWNEDSEDRVDRREFTNTAEFYSTIDLEHDTQLLDHTDPLDRLMLELIASKRKKKPARVRLTVSHQSEDSGDLVIDSARSSINEDTIEERKEAIDYDQVLNNAGVYTRDEVAKILQCKMSKLQLLYKKQLALLSGKLVYDRKKYLVMKERESLLPQSNLQQQLQPQLQQKQPSKENKLLQEAKKYRSLSRKDLYLRQKYDPRNHKSEYSVFNESCSNGPVADSIDRAASAPNSKNRCIHALNAQAARKSISSASKQPQQQRVSDNMSELCGKPCLPSSKYCLDHILNDKSQILFVPCNAEIEDSTGRCRRPVISSILPNCPLHLAVGETNNQKQPVVSDQVNSEAMPDHLVELLEYVKNRPTSTARMFEESESDESMLNPNEEEFPLTGKLVRIKEEIIGSDEFSRSNFIDEDTNLEKTASVQQDSSNSSTSSDSSNSSDGESSTESTTSDDDDDNSDDSTDDSSSDNSDSSESGDSSDSSTSSSSLNKDSKESTSPKTGEQDPQAS